MIWPFYTALLGVVFLTLSIRTVRLRGRLQLSLGDGGNPLMLRAIRAHANFAEYVPLGLLLVAGTESVGAPMALVHGTGLLLLAGRVVHAVGISRDTELFAFRVTGMALTFTAYLVAAGFILYQATLGGS